VSKISDADLVNAAARAMLEGRGELAEFLMHEVRHRRERGAGTSCPSNRRDLAERRAIAERAAGGCLLRRGPFRRSRAVSSSRVWEARPVRLQSSR
jgi:hypothetical protein